MRRGSPSLWVAAFLVTGLLTACGGGGGGGPAPTPTPSPLVSVCGGPVTSTPTTCLSVSPTVVPVGGTITLTVGLSDLEGDVNALCLGLARLGSTPVIVCDVIVPRRSLINERASVDLRLVNDVGVPLPAGLYRLAIDWGDAAGHVSNVATADFEIR